MEQDKYTEISFFDTYSEEKHYYDAFFPETNKMIIDFFESKCNVIPGALIADVGCGSGTFTNILNERGYHSVGVDLSQGMLRSGRHQFPDIQFIAGDAECLPFASDSLDSVLLSAMLHHLPDSVHCANEVYRVLKKGGTFFAFDPNRINPAMYIYRDPTSPFYSSIGVTKNERPVIPREIAKIFREARFCVSTDFLPGLKYRYIASSAVRWLLPTYNFIDGVIFRPRFLRWFRPFVLTSGTKI
ncbi:MAG: hypothetical protein CMI55_00010 [Parcubacteria group bacterium]|jgi:ubiquinone/menaquinone biosynthesis C-methylase UbiE|nr:hypothetical protein [Parcubacteria group bacterium]|tara:strand:+ start:336 stop:1064 length:729 start_codon:yes stop_codon:yes gene_type:complete